MKISSENACRLKIKLYLCIAFENKRITKVFGEMAEWSIAAVLKTVVLRGTGGSNPSLSAKKRQVKFSNLFEEFYLLFFVRRLAAARGWTCQSLSLRLEVVNHGFATFFLCLLLNIPYLFFVLLSKKELKMNRYEWKVKWEWVTLLLIVILVWALCMHC